MSFALSGSAPCPFLDLHRETVRLAKLWFSMVAILALLPVTLCCPTIATKRLATARLNDACYPLNLSISKSKVTGAQQIPKTRGQRGTKAALACWACDARAGHRKV